MTVIAGTPGVGTPPGISLTVPAAVTATMTALIIFATADGADWDPVPAKGGATFVLVDDRAATNHRVTVWRATGLVAADTITLSSTVSKSCNVWHVYTDEWSLFPGSVGADVRVATSTSTTSGSVTPAVGQQVLMVATERTTATPTTVSSVTSSGSETITEHYFNEQANTVSSAFVGTFTASAAAARTATITYSDTSTNGYAALILLNIPASLAEDDFTGTDGDALSSTWANGSLSTGSATAIQGNAGRFTLGSAGGYSGQTCKKVNITNPTDAVWSMRFRWPAGEVYPQIWMRHSIDAIDGAAGYYCEMNRQGGNWHVGTSTAYSRSDLTGGTGSFSFSVNTWYRVRFGVVDDEVKFKLWLDGVDEPAAWLYETTDTTYTSAGRVGLRCGPGNVGSVTFEIDDFTLNDTFDESAAGTAALTGAGTLTASGVPTPTGAPSFTASGALSASGVPEPTGGPALGGTGTLTLARTPAIPGTATLAGAGTLSVTGAPAVGGAAAVLAGAGTLSAATAPATEAAAVLSGAGVLAAVGGQVAFDTAARTGSGTLTATGVPEPVVAVAVAGAGVLSVARTPALPGEAAQTGAGVLAVGVIPQIPGSATLAGAGTATAEGVPTPGVVPILAGAGVLAAAGTPALSGAVSGSSGTGQLAAAGVIGLSGSAVLAGAGSLSRTVIPHPVGTGALAGIGALSMLMAPRVPGVAAAAGSGGLSVTGVPNPGAVAALGGTGTLTLARTPAIPGTAALSAVGVLLVALSGDRGERGEARLAATVARIRLGDPV
jgi:hypothetical protein